MATVVAGQPPPILDRSLQQALMAFAQPIGQGLAFAGQRRLTLQDLANLMAYQQGQYAPAAPGTIAGGLENVIGGGLSLAPAQFPQMQSQLGQQLVMQGLGQQIFGDPFGLQQAQAEYYGAKAEEVGRPETPKITQTEMTVADPNMPNGFAKITYDQFGNELRRRPLTEKELPTESELLTKKERERAARIKAGLEPEMTFEERRIRALEQKEAAGTITEPERLELSRRRKQEPKLKAGLLQIAKAGDGTGLPKGTVYQADPQGNIRIISEISGVGLSTADKTKLAVSQAKEFRADPRIKNFQIIERSERGMQAALKQAISPNVKSRIASDQALGVLFQKMLDPESVVRESEFARTPEGAAAINRLLAIAPQLRLGGLRLLDEDRQALVEMAQKLLNEAKISANRAFDEFETRANEIGLNKKIIFGGAKKFDIPNIDVGIPMTTPQQFTPKQINAELRRRGEIP